MLLLMCLTDLMNSNQDEKLEKEKYAYRTPTY